MSHDNVDAQSEFSVVGKGFVKYWMDKDREKCSLKEVRAKREKLKTAMKSRDHAEISRLNSAERRSLTDRVARAKGAVLDAEAKVRCLRLLAKGHVFRLSLLALI